MNDDIPPLKQVMFFSGGLALFVLIIFCLNLLVGCTISFQNIDTHGTATDLVDENQTASPDVKSDLSIPLTP